MSLKPGGEVTATDGLDLRERQGAGMMFLIDLQLVRGDAISLLLVEKGEARAIFWKLGKGRWRGTHP